MNRAIERIKGYCCEVTQDQWEELVKVADEVGVRVSYDSRRQGTDNGMWGCAMLDFYSGKWRLVTYNQAGIKIPYPEFLAKLKGVEKWQPKAGEMVEGGYNGETFTDPIEFIAYRGGHYWAWEHDEAKRFRFIRPIRPTITREQAEKELNKRIID